MSKFPIPAVKKTFGVEPEPYTPLPPFVEAVWVPPSPEEYKYVPRSTKVTTVKVHHPAGGFCVISEPEFDPHQHTLWVEPATAQS